MGIINLSPYSFASKGRCLDVEMALHCAEEMIANGAGVIDVGAEPTNPGTHPVTNIQEECDRLVPVIEKLREYFDIPISVDTSKPEVMRAVIAAGATMINDVRALREEGALETIAELNVPVCLMHMLYPCGVPSQPLEDPYQGDVLVTVKAVLQKRIEHCIASGIKRENIIIDPGFGHGNFGKNTQDNLLLAKHLAEFKSFNLPILVGISRKTVIGEILNLPVEERLTGSLALTVLVIANGASIIRAHDVKETVQTIDMAMAVLNCE